ncbi:MAG: tRNA (adenosine(37)-N6)-threonylcarbamoyltransferase complex transferase subunit TsaD, partial [Armatimonadetes bacterium]|nr:tRNA (adenosine(37)-N6)-threonylcarbamoyltransferase complex transferase subunit TsaD [Armatimonadota bacterium]
VALCGGVAASRGLRRELEEAAAAAGLSVSIPAFRYCTDNAAMIACAGYHRFCLGGRDELDLDVGSTLPLPRPGEWLGAVA